MTVNELKFLFDYVLNKYQTGDVSPEEFNSIINQSQKSFCTWLLGEVQQYQNGRAIARVGFGANEVVRNKLTPVIYGYILNPNSSGFAAYPRDFQYSDTISIYGSIYNHKSVSYTEQTKLWSRINSSITPVQYNPIYLLKNDGFQFYPQSNQQMLLSYVRNPPEIRWAYTLDANDIPVYDAVNSIDPVWYDIDCYEILVRALSMTGVNLQATQVSQYANMIKTQGQ